MKVTENPRNSTKKPPENLTNSTKSTQMSTFRCISYWKGGFPVSYLSIFSECVDTENVWKIMVSPGIFEFQGHYLILFGGSLQEKGGGKLEPTKKNHRDYLLRFQHSKDHGNPTTVNVAKHNETNHTLSVWEINLSVVFNNISASGPLYDTSLSNA